VISCQQLASAIFHYSTCLQIKLYQRFLESDEVKLVLNKSLSPLAALTVLKKISNHPLMLGSSLAAAALADGGSEDTGHVFDRPLPSHEELLADSAKLGCFSDLMKCLIREGHRTLVFSQSRKLLDIIEKVLDKIPVASHEGSAQYVRIDGSIIKPEDRQRIVARFNENEALNACLLTTGVGSLGLTLTGADRVVIFDPSWNPAVEQQAVSCPREWVDDLSSVTACARRWTAHIVSVKQKMSLLTVLFRVARWRRRCTKCKCSRAGLTRL
jgi:SNF2 family DNA or RNA helicase